jgi:hypothetical protein
MSARPRYRVRPIPGSSDDVGHAHFDVAGPDINHFAVQYVAAAAMQQALDRPQLTPFERNAVRTALALVLAGETDDSWSEKLVNAMRSALEKLR